MLVTGPWSDSPPLVKAFDASTSSLRKSFLAYASSFTAGVRVAVGDVNGDGWADIVTGAGPGGAPHVKVFDGATGDELASFFAYPADFTGGVYVAAGDVDGDGRADIVTGAGPGAAPHVKVFSGSTGAELSSFFAYDAGFSGGVRVAVGDVNGDGQPDIVTGAGPGAGPHVKVFDGATGDALASFFAYDAGFGGGVFVAAGDVDADGRADIVTGAGAGGGPHVKVFSGATGDALASFFAYAATFDGGISVGAADVDGDGRADIVTGAGPGAGPHVKVFSGSTGAELSSFFAYAADFSGGVFVAVGNLGQTPPPSIGDVLAATDQAIADGDLVGDGAGTSADGRLAAWVDMLNDAAALLASGATGEACGQLAQAHLRADGAAPPSDFVRGPAREGLANLILELWDDLGCATF
jgi:hypothetical protein